MEVKPSVKLTIGLMLLAGIGCAKEQRILNPDVDRDPVVFESDEGMSAFEEELESRYEDGQADIAQLQGRLSLNAFFNQQVQRADRNGDGIISDSEAQRYSQ